MKSGAFQVKREEGKVKRRRGKAPKAALKLRVENGEWRIGEEKLLASFFCIFNTAKNKSVT